MIGYLGEASQYNTPQSSSTDMSGKAEEDPPPLAEKQVFARSAKLSRSPPLSNGSKEVEPGSPARLTTEPESSNVSERSGKIPSIPTKEDTTKEAAEKVNGTQSAKRAAISPADSQRDKRATKALRTEDGTPRCSRPTEQCTEVGETSATLHSSDEGSPQRSFEHREGTITRATIDIATDIIDKLVSSYEALTSTARGVNRLNPALREQIGLTEVLVDRIRDIGQELKTGQLAEQPTGTNRHEESDAKKAKDLQARIANATNEEAITLLGEKWPIATFTCTEVKRKSFANSEASCRVLISGSVEDTHQIHRALTAQFPHLGRAEKQGRPVLLKATETLITEDGSTEEVTRALVVAPDKHEDKRDEAFLETARTVCSMLANVEHTTGRIEVMTPEKGTFKWRKAFEIVGTQMDKSFTICARKGPKDQGGRKPPQRRARAPELIIRAGEKSFAEMVKELSEDGGLDDLELTRVCVTRDGALNIRMGTDTSQEAELRARIRGRIAGANISTGRRRLMELPNLVPGTSDAEVIAAVKRASGNEDTAVTLVVNEDTRRGTWRAKVLVPEELVHKLEETRVRVGLVTTNLRRPPDRCARCRRTGHDTSKCRGPDRRDICFRCQKKGHMARNCHEDQIVTAQA